MKLLGYKAGLALSAIAVVGFGITNMLTTKAASLQATIASLLKTQALTGNQATKQDVLQKMSGARFVHLS